MKVIFQDIDGVLYPCFQRKRLKMDPYRIKQNLIEKDSFYKDANAQDLAAAYEGFDKDAMKYLKMLVDKTGAKIVISSSWRLMHSLMDFKKMFHIYELDEAIVDMTPQTGGFLKEPSILAYLQAHEEITSYVVLDDINMASVFGEHSIVCGDVFDEECYEKALAELLRQA